MSPKPVKNVAASFRQRLLNMAKADNRPFNEVLQYFAMERLLYRHSKSTHADRFILKGALMLRMWHSPEIRPTMDIDSSRVNSYGGGLTHAILSSAIIRANPCFSSIYRNESTTCKGFHALQAGEGLLQFSLEEAENAVGTGRNTWEAIDRWAKQGWLFSPSKGFYVIIDPQHQGSGFLPVEWFIDDWMKHLSGRYYLGILTAAMLHGASHQKPQQVQVVRDRVFADVDKVPYHISFFYKKAIPGDCCEQRQSPAGYFWISNPEATPTTSCGIRGHARH